MLRHRDSPCRQSPISVKPPDLEVWAEGVPGPLFFAHSPNPLSAASSLGAIKAKAFPALARYLGRALNKTSHRDKAEICTATYWERYHSTD